MNKERIKTIALIAASLIAFICAIGWIVQATKPNKKQPEVPETTSTQVLLSAARASTDDPTEYTLTATVRPAQAENTAVDWSIAWKSGTPKENEPVTNYVTVTPSSDGALTATVKCVKPFYGSIAIVTVTTREGGFTATSTVNFDGAPTELIVNNGNTATQKLTETCTYSVSMNNVFGYVGDKYRNGVTVKSVTVGGTYTSCNIIGETYDGTVQEISEITSNKSVADLKNGDKSFAECLNVTFDDNGSLTVKFTAQLQYMCRDYEEQSGYFCAYDAFHSDLNAYADITLECNTVETTFRINLTVGVYGVSLDLPSVTF